MSYRTQTKKWAKRTVAGYLSRTLWPQRDSHQCPRVQPQAGLATKRKPALKTLSMSRTWCTIIKQWEVVIISSRRWIRTSRKTSSIVNQTLIKTLVVVCRPHPQARQQSMDQNSEENPMKYLKRIGWWIPACAHHKLKQSSGKDSKLD